MEEKRGEEKRRKERKRKEKVYQMFNIYLIKSTIKTR